MRLVLCCACPAPGGSRLDVKALIVFFALTCALSWSRGISLAVAHLVVRRVASGTQAATGMLAALVSSLVMVQGATLIVLGVRARRQGRPSVLGPAWAASSG